MNLDHVKICFFNYISVLMKNIALLPWREEQVLVFIITLMDFFHLQQEKVKITSTCSLNICFASTFIIIIKYTGI